MRYLFPGIITFVISLLTLDFIFFCSGYNVEFFRRTDDDWQRLWHSECHRRCRSDLQDHIELACAVDIYRIYKRQDDVIRSYDYDEDEDDDDDRALVEAPVFFNKRTSASFLSYTGGRQKKKRGIMQECCYDKGCTWEEYAETCHHYSRLPATKLNNCS